MVRVRFDPEFEKTFSRIKDATLKEKIVKQIIKIKKNPDVGKPMKYGRKGTREVYVPPFRLSYSYIREEAVIFILDIYHKDSQ